MILTVTLNPALDLSLELAEFEFDEVNRATAIRKSAGGKGINVSRVLKELNEVTMALTILAADSVAEFKRLAKEANFSVVYINVPGEMRTNILLTDRKTGQTLKVNQPGAPLSEGQFQHFSLLYRQQIKRAKFGAIGGSLPPGVPQSAYLDLCREAASAEVPMLVDAQGPALLECLPARPLIAKPNRRELAYSLGADLDTQKDIIDGARELQSRGARGVIVTDGAGPVIAIWGDELWIGTPPRIKAVATTGAGDSMAAGFLSGLNKGKTFADALRLGIATGAASCLTPEDQLARGEDVERLVKQVKVNRLLQ